MTEHPHVPEPLPIEHFSDLADRTVALYDAGLPPGDSAGWRALDPYFTIKTGMLVVVTGIPNMGKSELVDAMSVNLAKNHGWKFGLYSPENYPSQIHMAKLCEKVVNKPFGEGPRERMTKQELLDAMVWVDEHFLWLSPAFKDYTSLLDAAMRFRNPDDKFAVILDPWNAIETRGDSERETRHVLKALNDIRQRCRDANFTAILVAHPQKMLRDPTTGKRPVPTPYDISGSAHWFNCPDAVLTVHRDVADEHTRVVQVHVQKCRFKHLGRIGLVELSYDRATGTYSEPLLQPESARDTMAKW